jgi:saccharopine dehydrogenase (NAD+, L-lysine-forming)
MPLFRAALQAGTHYLDMAASLSCPHPDEPYRQTGVKLGDEQFALAPEWEQSGKLALTGMGVEPGLSDVFARYAADELFCLTPPWSAGDRARIRCRRGSA